jgi:4-amino-4-deoxy-L-arabinose transferase-like glycosyltransferase
MPRRFEGWSVVLLLILASRLVSMALLPFLDTTEPRYAEITRLMLATGDWITPWFEPGVPFWGKPPLSFWAQAASGGLFGITEFALRLPSWLASVGIVALTWCYATRLWGSAVARWSVLILATMALLYMSAGTVMTDSLLALGTTLSLVSFALVLQGETAYWRWLFFLGLVIGLLAKGPLALVLTGMPIALWLAWHRRRWCMLRALPWLRGSALTLLLGLPWYLAAELKTPGFLDYFLVGEHFRRFVDSGWNGDLYGTAHDEPKGMIWAFWLMAACPWSFIAVPALVLQAGKAWRNRQLPAVLHEPQTQFAVLCAVSLLLFFTLAGNILWTYILPTLPFAAVLLARWVAAMPPARRRFGMARNALVALAPVMLTVWVMLASAGQFDIKTEKSIVSRYQHLRQAGDSPLLYLDRTPFSARFYSQGTARRVTQDELRQMLRAHSYQRYFLALPLPADAQMAALDSPNIEAANSREELVSFVGAAGQHADTIASSLAE